MEGIEPHSAEWERMRKNSHKEVERRRREVINQGIDRLALLIPGVEKNKGKIISQAVDYIHKLKVTEEKNIEKWTIEKLLADQAISELTAQVEALKGENKKLRRALKRGGRPAADADAADELDSAAEDAEPDAAQDHYDTSAVVEAAVAAVSSAVASEEAAAAAAAAAAATAAGAVNDDESSLESSKRKSKSDNKKKKKKPAA
ncbi:basic helix-loop-helix protein [Coemansia sp. RSA 2598]|nr:basic helix-loop-helix protein [Coemansia sp. RSA 2598]